MNIEERWSMTVKAILIPVAALAVAGATFLAARPVLAQGQRPMIFSEKHDEIISRLATKLGKSEAEVKAVFDEVHAEQKAKMQALFTQKLEQAVSEGKITAAQKELIVAKHAEMQKKREAEFEAEKNLTPEQRRAKHEARRAELESWASANGIDLDWVMPKMVRGAGRN